MISLLVFLLAKCSMGFSYLMTLITSGIVNIKIEKKEMARTLAGLKRDGKVEPNSGVASQTELIRKRKTEAIYLAQEGAKSIKNAYEVGELADRNPISMKVKEDHNNKTRAGLFIERKQSQIKNAKRFMPRKMPCIHKADPSNFGILQQPWFRGENEGTPPPVPLEYRTVANIEVI